MTDARIVVIGGTHHNTLSMLRSFGKVGISPDVILCDGNKDSYVLCSKYIDKKYVAENSEKALQILRTEYHEKGISAVPIICSDDCSAVYNANISAFMDKQRQVVLAERAGLLTPKSVVFEITKDDNCIFDTFPCIVKPLASINGGKRINICHTNKDLSDALQTYDVNDVVQIQQYIPHDYEIVIDGVYVNGKTIIPGYIKKHRDIMGGTSFSTTYPIDRLPNDIKIKIDGIVKEIGNEGLFGVEMLVSGDSYYFVEINLRNDATTYSLVEAGANLPYIFVSEKLGLHDFANEELRVRQIDSMVEIRDFSFVMRGLISPWRWMKDLRKSECLYYYDKNDMRPFWKAVKSYVLSHLRR